MDGPAVRGREAEVESDLVGVVDSGGMAGGGVRALQSLDRGGPIAPKVATALVEDQAAFGQRNQVTAAVPVQQGVTVGTIGTRPVALRRLAVGVFREGDGIRDDLVTGVQTCALPIYPIEVSSRRDEPGVGEGGGAAGADLGPGGAAVGGTMDLVGGASGGRRPAEADLRCVDRARAQAGRRPRHR